MPLIFLSHAREMFDLQRLVGNWKRCLKATDEGLTIHTHQKQLHSSGSRIMVKCLQGSFSWKSCLCLTLPVLVGWLWQQPEEGNTDSSRSPAFSAKMAMLQHAKAEPLSEKYKLSSGSLYLFASSLMHSRAAWKLLGIFVSMHLGGRGGREKMFDPLTVSELRKLKVLIEEALPCCLHLS